MLEGTDASLLRLKLFLLRQIKVTLHLRRLMINFRWNILSPSPNCKCSYLKKESVDSSENCKHHSALSQNSKEPVLLFLSRNVTINTTAHSSDDSEQSRCDCVWCVGCVCVCGVFVFLCLESVFMLSFSWSVEIFVVLVTSPYHTLRMRLLPFFHFDLGDAVITADVCLPYGTQRHNHDTFTYVSTAVYKNGMYFFVNNKP